MAIQELIKEIDAEIDRLKEARALLAATSGSEARRGGPKKKSHNASLPTKAAKQKRNFTPEHRARIAAAQKRRWAAQKG